MLWRELRFRDASLIQMASLLIGAVAAVALALAGLTGEAIVLGAIAGQVAATVLFLIAIPPVPPRWHRRQLRDILSFGGPASAAGMLHVAITNVDYTILAARLSAAQTGFYWRAFQLGVVYQDKISGVFMRLAFPVYSRTKDIEELGRLHERASRVHAAVVVPLLAVLIVTAPDVVPWMFGDRWHPAVLPAQILAVAGMIAAILTGFAQVMLAAGRPKALMRFNVSVLAVYAGAVWVAAGHGIVAVSIAVVGVYVGMLVVVYGVLFRRVLGMPINRMVADLGPPSSAAAPCWPPASRWPSCCAPPTPTHRRSPRPSPSSASRCTRSCCAPSSPPSGATCSPWRPGCCRRGSCRAAGAHSRSRRSRSSRPSLPTALRQPDRPRREPSS